MNLVERVKAILLTPQTEWRIVDRETGDRTYLFTNYVAILTALPAVAAFIGFSFAGLGVGYALIFGVFLYVVFCAGWYVEAIVVDALAPTFGAQRNMASAVKIATYSSTAFWIAGIVLLIPRIAVLMLLGAAYSIYLLWLGLPPLMRVREARASAYAAIVVVVMFVIAIVVIVVLGMIILPI
jgi:Yip1 domain